VFYNTHSSCERIFCVTLRYTGYWSTDVVGLLLGAVVITKKRHIVSKDVVGLQVGDSKNNREFD
jgi:hypothetical protein